MSDNIFKFPNKGLDIEVDLEEEREYEEVVHAVYSMLEMHVAGIQLVTDVEWEHVMDAAISLALNAGLRSGLPKEELEELFTGIDIQEPQYDA